MLEALVGFWGIDAFGCSWAGWVEALGELEGLGLACGAVKPPGVGVPYPNRGRLGNGVGGSEPITGLAFQPVLGSS